MRTKNNIPKGKVLTVIIVEFEMMDGMVSSAIDVVICS